MRQSLTGKYNVTAYDGTATEGQLRQMYKAGISEMSARKGVTRIGVKSVTDGDHRHALTQLSVLDEFARKHGLSIVCVDTLYDETGAEINGEYRTGNNIVISLDADGGLYMPVVGHEVFHYAESIDTEQAGVLTQMVINTLEQTKGAEWLADRRAEYGKQYDKSDVDSEIAADFFGAAITQKEFGNYIRSAKMNKSFTKKIVNKIKQIVADLRGIMQKLRGQRLIYDATLDLDAETLDFFTDSIETILSQAGTEQAETAKATKNTADEGDVKYQLKKGAEKDVDRALSDISYRDDVYLTENSPMIIATQRGARNLPMMKASHIRENIFTEQEALKKGLKVDKNINYHGLGKELFLQIIGGLDEVQYAYRGTKNADNPTRRENYFLLISQYKDDNGNTVNVPVYIDERGQYNRVFIETNKIATVFGRDNISAYIKKEVRKGNLVKIKNKSTQASERTTPIVGGYSLNAPVDTTVSQKKPSVNTNLSESGEKITKSQKNNPDIRFQRKLPDVQQRLNDMSRSDSVSEAVEGAKALADELIDIVKSERLNMTETDGLMPQSTKVADIVRKYNDVRKTGVSNTQMTKDITDIFSDYMHGVGSSDTLINYLSDNIMKRELKSFEVYGTEAFDAVKALTEHGKFSVTPETAASLIDNWGSLGEVNRILKENYGFTVASAADERAANRSPWARTGQEIAEEIPYAFDGTDYTDNAKDGFEYETIAALVQSAERNPVIYRGWLTEAKTAE